MAPTIENLTWEKDDEEGWKTYYLKIVSEGTNFFKIGVCKGSVRKRYAKESRELRLEILKLWRHKTEAAAYRDEAKLFANYKGDRPFIGRCGPLRCGGNTETFSHDVIGGEIGPHSYIVQMRSLRNSCFHTHAYSGFNPRLMYRSLHGEVRYMDYSFAPEDFGEGDFLQVPKLSSAQTVVLATENYLYDLLRDDCPAQRWFPKKWVRDTIDLNIVVKAWSDYSKMVFDGLPFKVDRWTDWV